MPDIKLEQFNGFSITLTGFNNINEFYLMTGEFLDNGSHEKFLQWKHSDGSKEGLQKLINAMSEKCVQIDP